MKAAGKNWLWGCVLVLGLIARTREADAEAGWRALAEKTRVKAGELTERNLSSVLLRAFRPEGEVQALIFLPGVNDELFLHHHFKKVRLPAHASLLDAFRAIEAQGYLRVEFRAPFLLVHNSEDQLEVPASHCAVWRQRLEGLRIRGTLFQDRGWDKIEPWLRRRLKCAISPEVKSEGWWHFYRGHLSVGRLSGWEAVEAVGLSCGLAVVGEGTGLRFERRETGD